ncbi:hypothetical protein AGMMS49574_04760 [Bacteroidia bacterium]|nr:hypothetical protein AGMMS49574_04760 [Bacteroidia bacterium]
MAATKNRNPLPKGISGYFTYPDGAREASRAKAMAKITSSKAEAMKFLISIGYLNQDGEIAEPYK